MIEATCVRTRALPHVAQAKVTTCKNIYDGDGAKQECLQPALENVERCGIGDVRVRTAATANVRSRVVVDLGVPGTHSEQPTKTIAADRDSAAEP